MAVAPGASSTADNNAYADPNVTPSACNHNLLTVSRTDTFTAVTPTSSDAGPDNTTSGPESASRGAGTSTVPFGSVTSGPEETTVKSMVSGTLAFPIAS